MKKEYSIQFSFLVTIDNTRPHVRISRQVVNRNMRRKLRMKPQSIWGTQSICADPMVGGRRHRHLKKSHQLIKAAWLRTFRPISEANG